MGYDPASVKCPTASVTTSNSLNTGSNSLSLESHAIAEELIRAAKLAHCPDVKSEGDVYDEDDDEEEGESEEEEGENTKVEKEQGEEEESTTKSKSKRTKAIGTGYPPLFKDDGFTFNELKAMWECSHATGTPEEVTDEIFPDGVDLKRTKWKSIITVEPKAFFDKYLSQYPGDTRAVQPVVVFSHKPLSKFEELSDVCKVLDIAVVPDKPGTCVAVTETYHDVASYHMLHATRQPAAGANTATLTKSGEGSTGHFALTNNYVEGRVVPSEYHYKVARALLLEYFKYNEKVNGMMAEVPHYGKGKVVVAVLIEDAADMELFLNSYASAKKNGISNHKFAIFTTQESIYKDLASTNIKILYFPFLAKLGENLGEIEGSMLAPKLRRFFLQSWLAFAAANDLIKVMWQSPGTVWFERPDNIVAAFPAVETLWAFKGRKDGRAAPFFVSFDFFVAVGVERPVHLLHELILHFDLIMAWDSLDAVTAYRLSENNSRYGTTTFIFPPAKVLHTEMMAHDPAKIREAVDAEDKPMAIVLPKEYDDESKTKKILQDAGLWFLK